MKKYKDKTKEKSGSLQSNVEEIPRYCSVKKEIGVVLPPNMVPGRFELILRKRKEMGKMEQHSNIIFLIKLQRYETYFFLYRWLKSIC